MQEQEQQKTVDSTGPVIENAAPAVANSEKSDGKNPFRSEQKIMDSWGAKRLRLAVDWGVGLIFNSALSGFIVYYINPRPFIKDFKKTLNSSGIFNARKALEILSAYMAGIVTTIALSIIAPFEEKIVYRLNQMFGKDTDVKTKEMKLADGPPDSPEGRIEYEISRRVHEKKNWKDVWKARILGMIIVLPGNELLGRLINLSERKTGHSLDTAVWNAGGTFYDHVAKSDKGRGVLDRANNWFKNHGAGVADIRENVGDSYYRLEQVEVGGKVVEPDLARAKALSERTKPQINETRVATRELFRTMFGVEIPWTIVMAGIVAKWSQKFQTKRVKKERAFAIEQLKAEGIIPQDYGSPQKSDTQPTLAEGAASGRWTEGLEKKEGLISKIAPAQPAASAQERLARSSGAELAPGM